MNAGKSTVLLQAAHNYAERGMQCYLLTAQFDNRAGEGRIGSRIGIGKQADTFGKGEEQSGAELASYWFMRNAKIFNKLVQTTKPGDRVIVVYGNGHGPWLRTMIEKTQGYELEPVMPYLQKAADELNR